MSGEYNRNETHTDGVSRYLQRKWAEGQLRGLPYVAFNEHGQCEQCGAVIADTFEARIEHVGVAHAAPPRTQEEE